MSKRIIDLVLAVLFGIAAGLWIASSVKAEENEDGWYCYAPYGTAVIPEFSAERSLIEVRWLTQPRGVEVQSTWYYDEDTDTSICVMWVRMPEQILGDPDMDAFGHEALHCFIGDFHPED